MGTIKKYDLAVKTGSYVQNGEQKNRYANIGAVMEGDNGLFIVMNRHFNPAGVPFKEGSDQILISCFEPKQQDSQQAQRAMPAKHAARQENDDDVPF